ncbi:hypothetical protein PM082_011696 [Marasmius tenuissimus]|nr:hypothetical protein PM082_011696 [Marasmius tenuissimus]
MCEPCRGSAQIYDPLAGSRSLVGTCGKKLNDWLRAICKDLTSLHPPRGIFSRDLRMILKKEVQHIGVCLVVRCFIVPCSSLRSSASADLDPSVLLLHPNSIQAIQLSCGASCALPPLPQ